MRLYLSSYKFGNFPDHLTKLADANKKVAIIMNALDAGDPVRVVQTVEKQIVILKDLGLDGEQLDLRNYFGKTEVLAKKIKDYGFVWVHGGNTFVLKRAYEQSGFDKVIREALLKDEIVYAGFSAALVVIGPTLLGVEIVDNPTTLPEGYKDEIDLNGLCIIDFASAVHYKSDHPESAAVDRYVEFLIKNGIPYKTLRDGEVIIVDGKDTSLLK